MATPLMISELPAVTSLSTADAVAIVQGGVTYRTTPQAFITQAGSFTPSGSGAVSRTVQAAMRTITRSGDFDTTANFNTATDALTETIGMHSIQAVAAGLQFKFPTNAEATNVNVLTFVPYEFGMKIGLSGSGQNHDNRLEFFLGSADTSPPELSVRHNGNGLGARIQARNPTDDDGLLLDFSDATYPFIRFGGVGPQLTKEGAGILVQRNITTVGEAQNFRIANTYTVGGALEILQLGWDTNRGKVQTVGSGGGTQRVLDLNGSSVNLQAAGVTQVRVVSTASADRVIDLTGSNGGNPTISTTGGNLAITPAVIVAATSGTAIGAATSSSTVLNLPASTTGVSSVRLAHGAAPTSPVNGDMWTTTAGLYVQINGSTVGPLS